MAPGGLELRVRRWGLFILSILRAEAAKLLFVAKLVCQMYAVCHVFAQMQFSP